MKDAKIVEPLVCAFVNAVFAALNIMCAMYSSGMSQYFTTILAAVCTLVAVVCTVTFFRMNSR